MLGIYLAILFFVLWVIYGWINSSKKQDAAGTMAIPQKTEECCGAHAICQKLKASKIRTAVKEIEYYDDEELDVFAGRLSDSYKSDEIALFSSVFHTLQENDIAGWLESLQFRNIKLPEALRIKTK